MCDGKTADSLERVGPGTAPGSGRGANPGPGAGGDDVALPPGCFGHRFHLPDPPVRHRHHHARPRRFRRQAGESMERRGLHLLRPEIWGLRVRRQQPGAALAANHRLADRKYMTSDSIRNDEPFSYEEQHGERHTSELNAHRRYRPLLPQRRALRPCAQLAARRRLSQAKEPGRRRQRLGGHDRPNDSPILAAP